MIFSRTRAAIPDRVGFFFVNSEMIWSDPSDLIGRTILKEPQGPHQFNSPEDTLPGCSRTRNRIALLENSFLSIKATEGLNRKIPQIAPCEGLLPREGQVTRRLPPNRNPEISLLIVFPLLIMASAKVIALSLILPFSFLGVIYVFIYTCIGGW
jgi:hypothetical protein